MSNISGTGGANVIQAQQAQVPTSDTEALGQLLDNFQQLAAGAFGDGRLSKEEIMSKLPDGPLKDALIENFEAIMLAGQESMGEVDMQTHLGASTLGEDDLQRLWESMGEGDSIGDAVKNLAGQLMQEHGIQPQKGQSDLQSIRSFVENLQNELGVQDEPSIRDLFREFRAARNEGDQAKLDSLGDKLAQMINSGSTESLSNRQQNRLDRLIGKLVRHGVDMGDKVEKGQTQASAPTATPQSTGLDVSGLQEQVSALQEALQGLLDKLQTTGQAGQAAQAGDVDFASGQGMAVGAEDLANSFKALGDILQSGVESLTESVPDAVDGLVTAAQSQQAHEATTNLPYRDYMTAQENLKPLTDFTKGQLLGSGERPEDGLSERLYGLPENINVQALVQWVMRESYLDVTKDLKDYADKLKFHMAQKKEIRAEIAELREIRAGSAGAEPTDSVDMGGYEPKMLTESYDQYKQTGSATVTNPNENQAKTMESSKPETVEDLDALLKNKEEQLQTVGEDMQLAQTDLQNIMQKQQQTLQLMSNISKMVHDTSMAVIRKIG